MKIENREQYDEAMEFLSLLMDNVFFKGDAYESFFQSLLNSIKDYEKKIIAESKE